MDFDAVSSIEMRPSLGTGYPQGIAAHHPSYSLVTNPQGRRATMPSFQGRRAALQCRHSRLGRPFDDTVLPAQARWWIAPSLPSRHSARQYRRCRSGMPHYNIFIPAKAGIHLKVRLLVINVPVTFAESDSVGPLNNKPFRTQ